MEIINNKKVVVSTNRELQNILEADNGYEYIYLNDNITLENGICINENKEKIIIDGTYQNSRYTLTGISSIESLDTIYVNPSNKIVEIRNVNIEYANIYGVVYVPQNTDYSNVLTIYNNVNFIGTQLSFNPYGTTKIIDSIINVKDINGILSQEVCESNNIIIGGNTTISSSSVNNSLFYFRSDIDNPSVVFLCKSRVNISTDTKDFMNGTNKLNFTILHDTEVNLITGNGFAAYTIHGANNVLIDERATLNFIENKHQRVPMWSIFGNLTMRKGSTMQLINSYDNTPTDNYNIYFKGTSSKIILDDPKSLVMYTKNANVIYTNNLLEFIIRSSRINMWQESEPLTSAGDINNLPEYYWYKNNELFEITGTLTSTTTTITSHNFTEEELMNLSDLTNFTFQSRKQLSIGSSNINIHSINSTKNTISGHTDSFADVLIKYNSIEEVVQADTDGLFSYNIIDSISDDTKIEITSNVANSFIYKTRKITTPHNGELSLLAATVSTTFLLTPISYSPLLLPKSEEILITVVDSREVSSDWKIYANIKKYPTSQTGYILEDALVFKTLDDNIITLNDTPQIVFTGTNNNSKAKLTIVTWSKEKGPLLDLSNNTLEVNEEYFSDIYFNIEE